MALLQLQMGWGRLRKMSVDLEEMAYLTVLSRYSLKWTKEQIKDRLQLHFFHFL